MAVSAIYEQRPGVGRGLWMGLPAEASPKGCHLSSHLSEERRPAVGGSGGGLFGAEGTAGVMVWRLEGIRGAERKPGGSQENIQESGHRGGLGRKMGLILSVMEATGGFKQLGGRIWFLFLEDRSGCYAGDRLRRQSGGREARRRLEGGAGQRREGWSEACCPHVQSQPSIWCSKSLSRH